MRSELGSAGSTRKRAKNDGVIDQKEWAEFVQIKIDLCKNIYQLIKCIC